MGDLEIPARLRPKVEAALEARGYVLGEKEVVTLEGPKVVEAALRADGTERKALDPGWWERLKEDYEAVAIISRILISEELLEAGVTRAVAEYSGSSDEGWINSVTLYKGDAEVSSEMLGSDAHAPLPGAPGATPSELSRVVEQWAYDELEARVPGWEINEGSQGEMEFDLVNRTIEVDHSYNVEITETNPWSVEF